MIGSGLEICSTLDISMVFTLRSEVLIYFLDSRYWHGHTSLVELWPRR